MTTKKRAVLYARLSRDDRSRHGDSLQAQLEMCRKYAEEKGYTVIAELAEDARGASGADINLPQLTRVREMAQAGEFDVLVTRELDRLSRNLAKQLLIEQELRQAGVRIEYVLYDFPDTPEGQLNKNVRALLAEYERAKITERMLRGRRRAVEKGNVMVYGNPPYGYRLEEVDGKRTLVIDEEQAKVVRMIFTWYTQGDGSGEPLKIAAIARRLTEMRVPTWADLNREPGRSTKRRERGVWSRTVVWNILRNETYAGVWYFGKWRVERFNGKTRTFRAPREQWIPVEVPAIIDRKTWKAAQKRLEMNRINSPRNTKRQYLMGRRLVCGECGTKIHGQSYLKKGGYYRYYRCPAAAGNLDYAAKCSNNTIYPADVVDAAVWEWIKGLLVDPDQLAEGLRAEKESKEEANRPVRERLSVIEGLLERNRQQLDRLLELYLAGEFPRDMLDKRKRRYEEAIRNLEREQAMLTAQLEQAVSDEEIEDILQFAAKIAAGLEMAEQQFKAKRRIIEDLDVWATLSVEDGNQVAHVRCVLGEEVVQLRQQSTVVVPSHLNLLRCVV